MTVRPTGRDRAAVAPDSTIDNGATVTQIRLLDRVFAATGDTRYRDAALRGIDYLLAAQYPNGGWPQVYPLRKDYSRHITFNDDAMSGVLALLEDVVERTGAAVRRTRRAAPRARRRSNAATTVILRAQIRVDGRLTAWCAQHDAVTLEPRPARAYEHVSLSGRESVGIVRFLMRRPQRPEIIEAVDAAVGWLRRVRIGQTDAWARFYEIGTNRPIFSGRDGIVRYDISEIEAERRTGYAWVGHLAGATARDRIPALARAAQRVTRSLKTLPLIDTFASSRSRTASSTSGFSTPSKRQSTTRTPLIGACV